MSRRSCKFFRINFSSRPRWLFTKIHCIPPLKCVAKCIVQRWVKWLFPAVECFVFIVYNDAIRGTTFCMMLWWLAKEFTVIAGSVRFFRNETTLSNIKTYWKEINRLYNWNGLYLRHWLVHRLLFSFIIRKINVRILISNYSYSKIVSQEYIVYFVLIYSTPWFPSKQLSTNQYDITMLQNIAVLT